MHGLSCRYSGCHIPQHAEVNETICHALESGGVPAVLVPVGVCHDDGKGPDGMSPIPWSQGLPLLWDLPVKTLSPHLICLLLQVVLAGDNRATQFLIRKVAINVQRGNAASVMATYAGLGRISFSAKSLTRFIVLFVVVVVRLYNSCFLMLCLHVFNTKFQIRAALPSERNQLFLTPW